MIVGDYVDTALIVKSYIEEPNSKIADDLLRSLDPPFAFTHLHEIEIPNAMRLKRFRGEINASQESAAIRALRNDINAGRLVRPKYDLAEVFYRAERLSAKFSGELGTRSLDLLHIAAALEIGCKTFASFDSRQRQCARRAGLRLAPNAG